MSQDITSILSGWDFNPDELHVRVISGDDGLERIQMRVDLGLLQMELSGRPDGQRPFGFESLLDYHESLAERAAKEGDEYHLDADDCAALMREGQQYYHRYLSAFHLQRYDLVARDTERNLRLFAFVVEHAGRVRDQIAFDQYRPYVAMMRSRALALQALARDDYHLALKQIDDGIRRIREFFQHWDQKDREKECSELDFLRRWRDELQRDRPLDPLDRLREQLELAISLENYEEAARLRDQIFRLEGPGLTGTRSQ